MQTTTNLRHGSALKGCLIAVGIVIVLIATAGIIIGLNWKKWTVSMMQASVKTQLDATSLPQDQKDRIITKFEAVSNDWRDGKIDMPQLARVMDTLGQGPFVPLALVYAADAKYIKVSKIPEDEKVAARLALDRFARGIVEKTIPADETKRLMTYIEVSGTSNHQIKNVLTDEELRKFIAAAKAKADEAKVPEEPYTVNLADELDKAINQALTSTAPIAPPPIAAPK